MEKDQRLDTITTDDVKDAVAAGVLPQQHAQALLAFVAQSRQSPSRPDEESFRFIRSFNDVFVTIAIALVLFALNSLLSGISETVSMLAIAAGSWAMAEYFTRRRRMAFPSIVLLGTFVIGVFFAAGELLSLSASSDDTATAGGAIAAAVAAGAHWLRFHVPITVAAGMAALVVFAMALFGLDSTPSVVMLAGGLVTLAVAMLFDTRDRQRLTRKADIAFWLHMLAAPLIVHGLFTMLGILTGSLSSAQAGAVLAFYVAFGLLALIIDRRALLVSSLIYVLYAASTLIASSGFQDYSSGITALAIGVFLLLLSAGWSHLRALVVKIIPQAIRDLVPPAAA
ncbi:hypothetical protein [Anderseniella sp. Alg231-50]|uniref:hypothetical protein n=1 Tax=Anderseniella sp. Alg231-50 TaxID=1922226 RepID=UPI00307B62D0